MPTRPPAKPKPPAPEKLSIDDLPRVEDLPDRNRAPIDDRWTESNLIRAGYEYTGDGSCKTCGDGISFYEQREGRPGPRWLVLNEGVLDPHRCAGGRGRG